jgi:hypothetical protein
MDLPGSLGCKYSAGKYCAAGVLDEGVVLDKRVFCQQNSASRAASFPLLCCVAVCIAPPACASTLSLDFGHHCLAVISWDGWMVLNNASFECTGETSADMRRAELICQPLLKPNYVSSSLRFLVVPCPFSGC